MQDFLNDIDEEPTKISKAKTFVKENWGRILVIILIGYLVYSNSNSEKAHQTELAKKDMTISEISERADKQSEIEIYGSLADEARQESDSILLKINSTYELISEMEISYERALLQKMCFKDQIDRMVEGKEYSDEYCDEDQNLENYRKK